MIESLKNLLKSLVSHPVIDPKISYNDYTPLDLSVANSELKIVDLSSAEAIQVYIDSLLELNNTKVAFGGYNETRGIYARSDYFNQNNPETERNIHLGLDIWIAAGTSIHAPLDAIVHSFNNNTNYGDYGPTIILQHEVEDIVFYSLYGHLSTHSLDSLEVGQKFIKGEQIATLGLPNENGNYAPHIHFQIINDMQDYYGDYPGVSNKQDLDFYLKNCPDPNLLLNI